MRLRIYAIYCAILVLVCAGLLLTAPRRRVDAAAESVVHYLPVLFSGRTDGLGFEAIPGAMGPHQVALEQLAPVYLRSNFGDSSDPTDTLYQHYLAGGWAEVDYELIAELALWDELGAEPIIIFMYGGACSAPTQQQLAPYADFIAAAVSRYGLRYIEVWNEPDATGGLASLFGCFGTQYANRLTFLLDRVQAQVAPAVQVGVSFTTGTQEHIDMLAAVAPSADWVGFHHYAFYCDGEIAEPFPGSLMGKYELVQAAAPGKPVWLTEVNLLTDCEYGLAHQQAQADYLEWVLTLEIPVKSVLVYYAYPDWRGSGIRGTLAEQAIGAGYP